MRVAPSLWSLPIPLLLLIGCGADQMLSVESPQRETDASTADVRHIAATTEVRVRADDLTLWIDERAIQAVQSGVLTVTMKARTSSNISSVRSTVPDDAFGLATQTGPRSFEITLRNGHEINTILSGLPLFLHLQLTSGKTYGAKLSLAPTLRPSAGPVSVDSFVRPIYHKDSANLRYRGLASTSATGLRMSSRGGTAPSLGIPTGSRYPFDWEYSGLASLLDASSDLVVFETGSGAASTQQQSGVQLTVRDVGLGLGDPAVRWPTPGCSRAVYDCISALPATTKDYSACGSYRDVARCMGVDLCDVVPTPAAPFALRSKDASSLASAVKGAHDACPRTGGSWCSVGGATAFEYPRCVATTPTQAQVTQAALAETDRAGAFDPRYGRTLTRAELLMQQTFKTGLLSSIDAFAGDTDVRATLFESEESCHNCHQFSIKFVLYYPRTRTVVVVDGSYGYDS